MIEEKTCQLIADCRSLENGANHALEWLAVAKNRNVAVEEQAKTLQRELQQIQTAAHRFADAAARRMCVGIYGESRAGKSFLVNSLAKGQRKNFTVMIDGQEVDFLECINPSPSDSKEGTGVVTRFTSSPRDVPEGYPIFIRILSEMDIVKIIVNSSRKDIKHDIDDPEINLPTASQINEILEQLQSRATGTEGGPDQRSIYDLREHILQKYKQPYIDINAGTYWDRAAELAGKLSLDDRATLYGVLWGGNEHFTKLFLDVARAAESLGWCSEAACKLEALVKKTPNGFERLSEQTAGGANRDGSIISVDSLKELGDENSNQIEILPLNGSAERPTTLPKPLVTALIVELELKLGETEYPFFNTADVLDFPGLKARDQKIRFYLEEDKGVVSENRPAYFFLRGKVDYLFQRYQADSELTALFAVMNSGSLDLMEMRDRVNDWIENTLGRTQESRGLHPNTLFFVFNKFDIHLGDVGGGENEFSLRGRFNGRFQDGLRKLWGDDGWVNNWDSGPFRNCYWMRNTAIPCNAVDRDSNEIEIGHNEAYRDHILKLRELCVSDQLVRTHMHNPEAAFDAALEPNDGGVSYLVSKLTEVCTPDLKLNLLQKRLEDQRHGFFKQLEGLYDDPNGTDREELRKIAEKIVRVLIKGCIGKGRFSKLLLNLQLPEEVIAGIHSRPRVDNDEEDVAVPTVDDADDDVDIHSLLGFGDQSEEEAETAAPVRKETGGRAHRFAKDVIQEWIEYLNRLPRDEATLSYLIMDEDNFANLVSNLAMGAKRVNLGDKIAEHAAAETDGASTNWNDVGRRVVSITHRHIADYVTWLGFADLPRNARPKVPNSDGVVLFDDPPAAHTGEAIFLPKKPPTYGSGITTFEAHWTLALMELSAANAGVSGAGVLIPEDNDRLDQILKSVGPAA